MVVQKIADGVYSTKQSDIDLSSNGPFVLFDRLGNSETEISAYYIVKMCRLKADKWLPFSKNDIEAVYAASGHKDGYTFNQLIRHNWIIEENGQFYVTNKFVDCLKTPALWDQQLYME